MCVSPPTWKSASWACNETAASSPSRWSMPHQPRSTRPPPPNLCWIASLKRKLAECVGNPTEVKGGASRLMQHAPPTSKTLVPPLPVYAAGFLFSSLGWQSRRGGRGSLRLKPWWPAELKSKPWGPHLPRALATPQECACQPGCGLELLALLGALPVAAAALSLQRCSCWVVALWCVTAPGGCSTHSVTQRGNCLAGAGSQQDPAAEGEGFPVHA